MRHRHRSEQTRLMLRRLAEDREVQGHLRTGAVRLREAWGRASRLPSRQAVKDRKVHDRVREAASALTAAGHSLRHPAPAPTHRGRNVAVAAAGAGATAVALRRHARAGAATQMTP